MPVLPEAILLGAVRWLELLLHSDRNRARTILVSARRYADLTPTQYDSAYAWLSAMRLLDSPIRVEEIAVRVFEAAVLHSNALWIRDADTLIQTPDELPADVHGIAELLGLTENQAFHQVQNVWGKVDLDERKRVGDAGEFVLIELLAEAAGEHEIDHVAQRADGFGFDIAFRSPRETRNFEVKTTLRRGRTVFYLSRNEFRTMRSDPDWHLILVRLDRELQPVEIGSVRREWISHNVPADRTSRGQWESCRLCIPDDEIVPGVPVEVALKEGSAGRLLLGQ
ncbi:protein NO VEIN domain-containing protein [Nocardia thailandica]|uniref:Protein NO VEIN domain-containing protein n=1 Tax=Nocardia thailandica TaxID=257275 RepID=A0ABW6PSD5_9NOCA